MTFFRSTLVATASVVVLGSAACMAPSDTAGVPALTDSVWELQQIQFNDGKLLTATPPQNYTAEFAEDGQIFVRADCNRSIGSWTEERDGRLSITMGPTTLAACPPESISNDFLQALNNANIYFFRDQDLFIDLKFDSGTLQMSPASDPPLVGTVWTLQQIQFNDGTLLVPNPPENYTVEFADDGSISIQADCNRAFGQFTQESDGRLTVNASGSTLAACPPGSLGNEFVQALNNSAIAFFQEGDLFIDMKFDSGTIRLSAN
ncbi:MAG: META domain-containing protein [Nodosilinea sp.]